MLYLSKKILKKPDKIPVVLHNDSNCDYHFIIKELANEPDGQFDCLGEKTVTQRTFSVTIEKQIREIVMRIL